MEKDRQETRIFCGEDVIRGRLLSAYDALVDQEISELRGLGLPLPDEFEFDEHTIVVMDSELKHLEDTWEIPFLPRLLFDQAFNELVRCGVLDLKIEPEIDDENGKETGHFIKKYKRVKTELSPKEE